MNKYPNIKTHVNQLYGSIRSASRHAGGIVVGENLDEWMPLINSKGVRQTPWAEGQNVRHLEPMGFIKFDVLGLETLSTMEKAVFHILRRHKGIKNPTFNDIKEFYSQHLHPDVLDMNDSEVYKNVFHAGSFPGIFQFTECLTGDTKVLMPNDASVTGCGKSKDLRDFKVGDKVISYNEGDGLFEEDQVVGFLDQGEKETYEITLENGQTIRATGNLFSFLIIKRIC